jgi:hypothetical protein
LTILGFRSSLKDLKDESAKALHRRWGELLQELRVAQTGVQILAGFLLMVPFSQGFADITDERKRAYVAVLLGAVAATVLLLSPVALHRALFERGQRPWIIVAAHYLSLAGLLLLGATNVGAIWFVSDYVLGETTGVVLACVLLGLIVSIWVILPMTIRRDNVDD